MANKALVIHASYLLDDKYAKREAFELAASNAERLQNVSQTTSTPGTSTPWRWVATAR